MDPVTNKLKDRLWVIAAAMCFGAALFFRFALIGYGFIAYVLAGVGTLVLVFRLLRHLGAYKLRRVLAAIIVIGLICFIAIEVPIIASARTTKDPRADYLIVLGAGLNGSTPSLSMVNRLTAALDYLEKYPDTVAIVSGGQGQGEEMTEAQAMENWLVARGISPERIIREEKSTSTLENLKYSLEIIESLGGDPTGRVAIVSSEYHLYRAKLMAKELGAAPVGVAGKTSYPVLKLNYFIREGFAVAYKWVFQ
ncbi:MAG TPA: YdcF family protein [Clostridiales bacterium]|nr:YdcF family protein [Clostridiales bacterium]